MFLEAVLSYVYDRKFLYQVLTTLITFSTIQVVRFIRVRQRRFNLFKYYGIPGPEPNLIDGNYSLIRTNEKSGFETYSNLHQQYGQVYGFFIGNEPNIIITDLELLRRVFFEEGEAFTERAKLLLETPLVEGVLFASYPRWKFMRKVLSHSFSAYKVRGTSSTQFIEDSIKLMIDYIDEKLKVAKAANQKANIDIHDLMKSTSLHLISALAIKLPDVQVKENETNVNSLDSFLSISDKGAFILSVKFPFIKFIVNFFAKHFEYNSVLSLIHRRLDKRINDGLAILSKNGADFQQTGVMETLIKLHHEGNMTKGEVMANADSILIAGYDTTSTTLAYTFWVLAKYPEIQKKLRVELMAHGTESMFLEQVIKESMRLYPAVPLFTTRLATSTVVLDKWTIPKGTQVLYNALLMHRNPELWPEPEIFDPDRFKEGVDIHPCAYAPFGLGDRKCLGYQLAMLELKMVICDMLLRYKLKLNSPEELELVVYANALSKPREKIIVELDKL